MSYRRGVSKMDKEFRFLIIKRCNYHCWFCHHEGVNQSLSERLLNSEDYIFLYEIGRDYFEFHTATISGGEPLLHSNIYKICQAFYNIGAPITITTNAYYLKKWKNIGRYIKSINISVHTLQPFVYCNVIGSKANLYSILKDIQNFAYLYPDVSICLNVTLIEQVNNDEKSLVELIGFAEKIHAKIKFIELFPNSLAGFASLECIRRMLLKNQFVLIENSPRKQYFLRNNTVVYLTKIICASQEESKDYNLCNKYNDIYVSPDGKMLTCRNMDDIIDVWDAVKLRDISRVKNHIEEALEKIGKKCKLLID